MVYFFRVIVLVIVLVNLIYRRKVYLGLRENKLLRSFNINSQLYKSIYFEYFFIHIVTNSSDTKKIQKKYKILIINYLSQKLLYKHTIK